MEARNNWLDSYLAFAMTRFRFAVVVAGNSTTRPLLEASGSSTESSPPSRSLVAGTRQPSQAHLLEVHIEVG